MKHDFDFSEKLLFWHQNNNQKKLPWQFNKTMYRIWLSEIMLQQTQVQTVIPYYTQFILKFPTIIQLATARLDEILYMWSGLGYYARARNLHKTANIIVENYHGKFPEKFDTLVSLPGIGKSTAGAILSLALNKHYPILDSNIKRILIRYYALNYRLIETSKTHNDKLWFLSKQLIPLDLRISSFNQAMMNLGRLICTNIRPICNQCPVKDNCQSFLTQSINQHPIKKNQQKLLKKTTWMLLLLLNSKKIWLEKRSSQKIWKELFCFPEFCTFDALNTWVHDHNLHNNKYEYMTILKHKLSNIDLKIQPILLNINKQFSYNNQYGTWYDLYSPPNIGLPQPITKILKKLKTQ